MRDEFLTLQVWLVWCTGDEFASRLTSYVKRYLRRGIPSLFTDVKALYINENKVWGHSSRMQLLVFVEPCPSFVCQVAVIEQVFEGYLSSLRASSTFPDSSEWEAPTVLVVSLQPCERWCHTWLTRAMGCQWVLCFLTQHNSQLRRIEKALSYIEDVRPA